MDLDPALIEAELRRRTIADPLAFNLFNPAQTRFINAVKRKDPITIGTMGNGTGKTHSLVSVFAAIMWPTENPMLRGLHESWRWPKSLRLCAPDTLLKDEGPIQLLIRKLFPPGRYSQNKGGKHYHSQGMTNTGFSWDVITYDQDPQQMAGATKGAILYSEPPPRPLFNENLARLRAGGLTIMEMTPLGLAGWVKDDLIDLGVLKSPTGEVLGRVAHITGTIWDNCRELSPGGQLSKRDIEIMLSLYPEEERELRANGTFESLAGRIYARFNAVYHKVNKVPAHLEKWYKAKDYTLVNVIDPHDRKPFALGWYAVFPNLDVLVLSEFPDDSYPMFHRIQHFEYLPLDYAHLIKRTEEALGKKADIRLIDPNFGSAPCFSTHKTITQELKEAGERDDVKYDLTFEYALDDLTQGHMAVKSLVGDPEHGVKQKLYVMEYCVNHLFGMGHYSWKENAQEHKGLSEKIQQVHKDYPDLVRYLAMSGHRYIKRDAAPHEFFKPTKRGTYKGAT